jgi:hypothetical protein
MMSVSSIASSKRFIVGPKPTLRASISTSPCCGVQVVKPQASLKQSKETDLFNGINPTLLLGIAGVAAPLIFCSDPALAIGGQYGLIEGRSFALMHPAIMFFLFGASIYTGNLGLGWRRARELATKIKETKAQLPALNAEGIRPPSALDAEITQMEGERKELIGKKLNEKHESWGNLLLALGVLFGVAGPFNTYLRTGKLFPGPHLWAGATIVVLWALAAALGPSMKKGNEGARIAHIALNTVNVALFAWQIPTGLDIVAKVFEFTTWP